MKRTLFLWAVISCGNSPLFAAPNCPVPAYAPRATDQIINWFGTYVKPFRILAGIPDSPAMTMEQIEALIEKLSAYHRRSSRESLFFEAFVQQIAVNYARLPDFKGLDTPGAGKIYRSGSGPDLDFSSMCIDTRTTQFPHDTFGITLFGVNTYDCKHVGLKGLVFTETLVNGATDGECREDHVYYRRLIIPVMAGTNVVTFLCRKDSTGCARQ